MDGKINITFDLLHEGKAPGRAASCPGDAEGDVHTGQDRRRDGRRDHRADAANGAGLQYVATPPVSQGIIGASALG
ncbi:MAG: hypothetical protein M9895_18085 [Aquamicrobium sp.]|uniref:hypothetical protein n=1 Tax=Aquamicrobium sp. TaxID=1872579 RepID=UPI00349EE904|nr:hypothetical protein [Aquamicrobium sp.]MCO5156336.1 hypothetical protein [Aquamicrobium sp.]